MNLEEQRRTVILSLDIKYFMRNLISDVNYIHDLFSSYCCF